MTRSSQASEVLDAFHTIAVGDRVLLKTDKGRQHGVVLRVWNSGADFDVEVDEEPHHLIRYLDEVVYDPE